MKIIHQDLKKGEVKVKIENLNDLWYLSQIIEPEDFVKGKAERKINLSGADQKSQVKKVYITLKVLVEKIEFHKYSDNLRASGKIKEAPDDMPKEVYQTINLEVNSILTIYKAKWLTYHLDFLNEAKVQTPDFLAVIMDREEASFAVITSQGFKIMSETKGDVEKKAFKDKKASSFYNDVIKQIKEYDIRYTPKSIIIASPAFWKEDLFKQVKDNDLRKKIILATCSHSGGLGVTEILKRDELKNALKSARTAKEELIVERLMKEIKIGEKASYGIKDVERVVNLGAVENFLITDALIKESRQNDTYKRIDHLMKTVEINQGKIEIIDSENPSGKKLDGLGGIGAILRFRI